MIDMRQYEGSHKSFLLSDNHGKGCEIEAICGMFERGTMNQETFIAILKNFAAVLK